MSHIQSKPLLDAYKTIGSFVNGPVTTSSTLPFSLATICNNSFKIYSDQLAIKMVSPCFHKPILALYLHNQYTYIIVDNEIIKIRYHHVVNTWKLPHNHHKSKQLTQKQHTSILVFQGVIIVSIGTNLYVISEQLQINNKQKQNTNIEIMELQLNIIKIIHPVTYINKILVFSSSQLLLINPITQKLLFDYSVTITPILALSTKITLITTTPLLDMVALGLTSGQIPILNLRTSKIIFTMKQKHSVTALAFNSSDSLMASGDEIGNIILWDLQNKIIVYRLQSAFPYSVDSLHFVPSYSLITATSSKTNSIRQFRINLDDNKTLILFRQRTGCSTIYPIVDIKCHNNKQITFSTKNQTVFSSLYSHCNMYSLPHCLDSRLPYHLSVRDFSIEVYRERTVIGKLNIHQKAQVGLFSMSKKYLIIATKSRILKIAIPSGTKPSTSLYISCQKTLANTHQILLCKQHLIFIISSTSISILNFNQLNMLATLNDGDNCCCAVTNTQQTLLAFENKTKNNIEIWDMRNTSLSRQFNRVNNSDCISICFTSDNRYLVTALQDCTLSIWSILHSTLYKTIKLQSKIVGMAFTPDNSYLLTTFEGARQINIWWNYIGKIMSSQNQPQIYQFKTSLNYLTKDYRQNLNDPLHISKKTENTTLDLSELDTLLDKVEDSPDINDNNYNFQHVGKWMPLLYYDKIKQKNSILQNNQLVPSLPFFLDFKNLTQQQNKITKQLKQQTKNIKNKYQLKIDQHLSKDLHQIHLDRNSTNLQYEQTWEVLCGLSIAEVDYQLRRYLMMPNNLINLLKMAIHILSYKKYQNIMLFNIIITRILDLSGSQLCSNQCKQTLKPFLTLIKTLLAVQQNIIERCTAVATNSI